MKAAKIARSAPTRPAQGRGAGVGAVFEGRAPVPFRERVRALAGQTTFREPAGGRSTQHRPLPADHAIAAALSFGRAGRDDIGPDIAFDIALGRAGHAGPVLRWLGGQLVQAAGDRAGRMRAMGRCRAWIAPIAAGAYNALVLGHDGPPAPKGVAERDWGECLLLACLLLEYAAEDALSRAASRMREGA